MSPITSTAQLLAGLHEIVKPEVYLETDVTDGGMLPLASMAGTAIGVGPEVDIWPGHRRDNQRVHQGTLDDYYGCESCERPAVDLALIRARLFDDALRDFAHIERTGHRGTIVVFLDVLPDRQEIAWRVQPGPEASWVDEWCGDVFKVMAVLDEYRPDLTQILVDVQPSGALIVTGLDPRNMILPRAHARILESRTAFDHLLPARIIDRHDAVPAVEALDAVAEGVRSGHLGPVAR